MDILTFLGLDYRVASLIKLYFVVPGIIYQKSDQTDKKIMCKQNLRGTGAANFSAWSSNRCLNS